MEGYWHDVPTKLDPMVMMIMFYLAIVSFIVERPFLLMLDVKTVWSARFAELIESAWMA